MSDSDCSMRDTLKRLQFVLACIGVLGAALALVTFATSESMAWQVVCSETNCAVAFVQLRVTCYVGVGIAALGFGGAAIIKT